MDAADAKQVRLLALATGMALLLGVSVSAQTIRPIISEYQGQANGKFEVVNDHDRPLNVVVQVRGFGVDERGEMHDLPLGPTIDVKLSSTSLRIPPKQSRWVFYQAVADRAPAWFVLYATFSDVASHDQSGVNIQLELPHLVYILPKTRLTASDVHVTAVRVDREAGHVVVELENQGTQFGRITDVEVRSGRLTRHASGFALFPGQHRRVEIDWVDVEVPDVVIVMSKDFSLQRNLPIER